MQQTRKYQKCDKCVVCSNARQTQFLCDDHHCMHAIAVEILTGTRKAQAEADEIRFRYLAEAGVRAPEADTEFFSFFLLHCS